MNAPCPRRGAPAGRATALLAAAIALTWAAAAQAYRPPATVLLQRAMERQFDRGAKTLRVEMDTQSFELTGAPRGMPVVERWLVEAPGSVRKEMDSGDDETVEVRVGSKVLAAGKTAAAPVDLLVDQITANPPLSDDQAVDRFMKDMKLIGVNPEVVSFARFDGRVAYLIGSKPWENDKPQIWLDKDTLLLVRVVMVQKVGDAVRRTDVRYLGWGSPIGGNWFPASIEVWSDGKLVRRSNVREVEKGVHFDATLFSLR